jgi:enoyl-CoA hydratase
MAKDCVNKSYELPLGQGLEYEKRIFWSTFATKDQKEGMGAFAEKRKPNFKDE